MQRRDNHLLLIVVTIVAALIVFTTQLGRRDIVTSHEARVAQTARQMAAVGWPWRARDISVPAVGLIDDEKGKRLAPLPGAADLLVNPWLVPVINGRIRLQKPPLPYWCTAVIFRWFGVGEWQARIVPALLGAIGTLLVWDLARRTIGRRAAFPAALVWITTHFVVDEFRKSMADPYLAFFTLLAVWSWVRGGAIQIMLFYVAIGLAMLAKGPPVFISLVPALILSQLLSGERRRIPWWSHLLGAALALAIALPWYVYVLNHVPHARELWQYESVGEFGENVEKARPWWLYVASCFQLILPWTPIWIAGLALPFLHGQRGIRTMWRPKRARRRLFALGWFFTAVIIFSFANVKKNAYLLPVMPAMALTCGDAIAVMFVFARRRGFKGMTAVLASGQAAIGIGFAIGLIFLEVKGGNRFQGTPLAFTGLVASAIAFFFIAKRKPARWYIAQAASYLLILMSLIGWYQSARENQRSPRDFARALAEYLKTSDQPVLLDWLPEEASFYLPLDIPDGREARQVVLVIDDRKGQIQSELGEANQEYFRAFVDGAVILNVQRLLSEDRSGRWKAFLLTIQRNPVRPLAHRG